MQVHNNAPIHKPAAAQVKKSSSLPLPVASAPTYHFQAVFKTNEQMKTEFANFLRTIFYQLDEQKVFALMEEICQPGRSDEEIYNDLVGRIDATKKQGSIFYKIWSLFVVQKGMASQAKELLKAYRKEGFQNYMEIYDRRYLTTIKKVAGLPINGKTIALTDADGTQITPKNRLEAWAIKFPYNQHVKLSKPSQLNPLEHPEITYEPLKADIENNSLDLVTCIGGLHHTPAARLEPFLDSLNHKVKPGGIVLLREHDAVNENVFAMAYVVHSFVNAADGVITPIEQKEVRDFKPVAAWDEMMKKHGFVNVSEKGLILKDDPTQNALSAYMKMPKNIKELQTACEKFDLTRSKVAQHATWIEWANVRMSDDYADFVQDNHSYAFNYIGYLKQHWAHFSHFVKDTEGSKLDLILSDGMMMNLFILFTTTLSCGASALTSLPSQFIARCRFGKDWRNVKNLSGLEKEQAQIDKEYAEFIHHTPFYSFHYLNSIKRLWTAIYYSDDSYFTKFTSCFSALSQSLSYLIAGTIAAPIRTYYTNAFIEPETVKVIVLDPQNKLPEKYKRIMETEDGMYKLVAAPRYKDFLAFCRDLPKECTLVEVGGQKTISVDSWANVKGSTRRYEVQDLQHPHRMLKVYEMNVTRLNQLDYSQVVHIHE